MTKPHAPRPASNNRLPPLANFIFASRWLQLPLYLGLIIAQAVYVFHFGVELYHLVFAAFGSQPDIDVLVKSSGYVAEAKITGLNETVIMLVVLALIDVVMISNLLMMVIVGGYETFVSRLGLEGHPDQPEWLSHVNASVLKVKLAMAIIGISSIHLLKTFIEAGALGGLPLEGSAACMQAIQAIAASGMEHKPCTTVTMLGVMWQTIIHSIFILSAIGIAATDKIMNGPKLARAEH